jgi:hypothetical protein
MAEEHLGQRQDRQWLWTKIFSAFRLALDAKKLVLAAIGILITALGWLGLAYLFYASRTMPQWKDYDHAGASEEQRQQQFQAFKGARAHWNLLHELAGPQYPQKLEQPADVAQSLDVYEALEDIYQANHRLAAIVKVHEKDKAYVLELAVPEDATYKVTPYKVTPLDDAEKLKGRSFNLAELQLENGKDGNIVRLDNAPFRVDQNFEDLRKFREGAESRKQLQDKIDRMDKPAQRKAYEEALALYTAWTARPELLRIKPAGRMRVLPWFEDRGPNPYLMIADVVKRAGGAAETTQPWRRGDYVRWLFADEIPVLLEPLFKFLTPVVYFFDRRAGVWEHLYLALVLLFTLAVWGFFGGAITRIAAVQFARGERITLRDALGFARDRWLSFFAAPIFPLFFLILMTIALIIFGFVELIDRVAHWLHHGHRPGGLGRLAADVCDDQHGSERQLRCPEPFLQLRLSGSLALSVVLGCGLRLRGGRRLLRDLHGLAAGVSRQVGCRPDAGHGALQSRALVFLRIRPDLLRLARSAHSRQSGGRGAGNNR